MSVSSLQVCLQESLANTKVSAPQPCWLKTDFDVKLALKVIHFAINYRQTRASISPCNIAGHISDVSKEVATQIAKSCRRRQPHCHLTPPLNASNFWKYKVHADIRRGSPGRGRQMTVGLSTTATFGDLCGYFFGNVRDKTSNITWRYATLCKFVGQ